MPMNSPTGPDFLQNYLSAKDATRQRAREDVADQMAMTNYGQAQEQRNRLMNLDPATATPQQLMQAGLHQVAFTRLNQGIEDGKKLMAQMLGPLQRVKEAGYTQEAYDQALQSAAMLPGWEYVRDKIPAVVDPKVVDSAIDALGGAMNSAPKLRWVDGMKQGDQLLTGWIDENQASKTFGRFTPVAAAPARQAPEGFTLGPDGKMTAIPEYWNQKKQVAAAGASRVSVTNTQEKEEAKTVGKGFGEAYIQIQQAGNMAGARMSKNTRLMQLLDGVETGKLTPMGTELANLAQSLGWNVDPKLGNKQAAMSLSNEMALELRNPSGGAGMPGALSDKDREFLVSMVPGLATTPDGRKLMLETSTKLAKRDQQVAAMARKYRTKNGTLDEGFYDELQRFSDANPLFKAAPAKPAASPAGGAKFLGYE